MIHCPGMATAEQEYYKVEDFILGSCINVYNRKFLLLNCDRFTKDYYKETFGIDQSKQDFEFNVDKGKKVQHLIPPHNGIGSEEDSLGNCFNLIPKPPKQDMQKMFIYNRVILRYECKMISRNTQDNDKDFLLSFYCGDDTLMVY